MPNDDDKDVSNIAKDSFGQPVSPITNQPTQPTDIQPAVANPAESIEQPITQNAPSITAPNESSAMRVPAPQVEQQSIPPAPAFGSAIPTDSTSLSGGTSPVHPSGGGKKKFVIGGLVAGLLVLLAGGSALAYTVYQNPEKVVLDGIVNIMSSTPTTLDGDVTYEGDDAKVSVNIAGKGNEEVVNGKLTLDANIKSSNMQLKGSVDFAAESNGNGYVKLNGVSEMVEGAVDGIVDEQAKQYKSFGMTLTPQQIAQAKQDALNQYEPIIKKIDNKWIKFAADKDSETSEEQKCVSDVYKKFQSDSKMRSEVADAYKDNRFIIINDELGLKNGSYGYVLKVDDKKVESFAKAAESTTFVKEITKCTGDEASSADLFDSAASSDDTSKGRVELWVSQWSHQITGLNASGKLGTNDADTLVINLRFGYDSVDVSVPSDVIESKDLEKDFEAMIMGSGSSSTSGMSGI